MKKLSLFAVILFIITSPRLGFAETAGEILKQYEGLNPKQRQE